MSLSRAAIGCLVLAAVLSTSAAAGEWRTVAPLPHPRWFHMAGVGSDGRIYAYGGYVRAAGRREYGVGEFAIDIFDLFDNSWQQGPAITSLKYETFKRITRGRLDEDGTENLETIYRKRVETIRLNREVPSGRADPLAHPMWPMTAYWLPFESDRGMWAELAIGPRSPGLSGGELLEVRPEGPAWYRYTPTLATSSDGLVYITGGSARPAKEPNAQPEISTAVEVWDARTNEWRELAPMRHARMLHAAAVDRQGRLFVFGGTETDGMTACGRNESREERMSCDARSRETQRLSNRSLASVEMYDPETKRWSERAPMPIPRQAMGADLGADGRIYVVGGAPSYTHPRPMAVVEIYDPERDTWETGPSLRYRRRSHAVVATPEGRIYAIGGFVGPRERTLRQRLAGDFIEADLGATVEVLDTRPKP